MSFSAIIALVKEALRGLASVEALVKMIVEQNLIQRLADIERRQVASHEAVLKLSESTTLEEKKLALKQFADSWHS